MDTTIIIGTSGGLVQYRIQQRHNPSPHWILQEQQAQPLPEERFSEWKDLMEYDTPMEALLSVVKELGWLAK